MKVPGAPRVASRRAALRLLRSAERRNVLYWPPFEDRAALTEAYHKSRFYFGSGEEVVFPVARDDLRPDPDPPSHLGRFPAELRAVFVPAASVVRGALARARGHWAVLYWRTPERSTERLLRRFLPNCLDLDPRHCEYEPAAIAGLYSQAARPSEEAASRERFLRWRESLPAKRKVYVLCTGPSLARWREIDFSDGWVVACNSIVSNLELMEHARPDAVMAADPVFHFGPSAYAERFREDLSRSARRFPFAFFTLDRYRPFVRRLAAVPADRRFLLPVRPGPLPVRLDREWAVPGTANILTLLMLPLAFTLADSVVILGADGRTPGDSGFWSYDGGSQRGELLESVRAAHPAFFARRDYATYYADHCAVVHRQVAFIERAGGTVRSLAPSRIPALAERPVAGAGAEEAPVPRGCTATATARV